ncbi:peroxiredoxin [Achromobacter marplatensis]|uniref:peroxiredoxin n=1 Tax=Achromobacter marplatensis TaxID=470868 RepID=UPI003D06F592
MTLTVGDRIPGASLLRKNEGGFETVNLANLAVGRKVVLFAVPGAFTGTCTSSHVPSFMRTFDQLIDQGVDEIVCISVNDPFVMEAWGGTTGATSAGITMLADPSAEYTRAAGFAFSVPEAGLHDRAIRHALFAVDGVVKVLHVEKDSGVCETTAGEAMLESIRALE